MNNNIYDVIDLYKSVYASEEMPVEDKVMAFKTYRPLLHESGMMASIHVPDHDQMFLDSTIKSIDEWLRKNPENGPTTFQQWLIDRFGFHEDTIVERVSSSTIVIGVKNKPHVKVSVEIEWSHGHVMNIRLGDKGIYSDGDRITPDDAQMVKHSQLLTQNIHEITGQLSFLISKNIPLS